MAAIAGCQCLTGRIPRKQQINRSLEDLSPRSGGTKKFFGVPNFVLGIAHNETYARGRLARRINPEICVAVDGVIFNTNELADEFNVSSQTGLDPLVQLYSLLGVEFIPKLNGHFAIVVWDGANQRLILARDAIGSKPLYYAVSESKVVLASEIRGFRAFDGFRFKPDFQTIDNYLTYSYAIPPRTLAVDIKQVRHGEYIIFNKGCLVNESIFVRPATRILTSGSEKEWATELERQLSASVLKRMNSSKRVGFLLSGGHDTAAIIAAGSVQSSARIKTFTLRFLGCPEMDESSHARNVSKHFGTEHTEVDVTSSCIEFLPQICTSASLPPVNASSLLSFSLFKQISPSVDTVLCGDGGNDLLGGHYRYNQVLAYARNHQSPPLRRFLFAYGRRAYHMLKGTPLEPVLQTVARSFFARIGKDVSEGNVAKMDKSEFDEIAAYYIDSDSFWREEDKRLLYSKECLGQFKAITPCRFLEGLFDYESGGSIFQQLPYVRMNSFIPYVAMQYVESTAAANHVQPLFPLLDQELVQFIYELPFESVYGKSFRHLMRKALAGRTLPDQIFKIPSKGFRIPVERWMRRNDWKEVVYDHLDAEAVKSRGWFSASYIQTLLNRFYSGRSYRRDRTPGNVTSLGLLIWSLVALEAWARKNLDS